MEYDALIGKLYDVIREVEDDLELVERLYALNFDVRKNGIRDKTNEEWPYEDEDVRITLEDVIFHLQALSDQAKQKEIKHHLYVIQQELSANGITPSF